MTSAAATPAVWNVPNVLSAARIVLSALLFVALSLGEYWWSLGLFVVAAVTDAVDGYWARRFQQITPLGRVLDPVADKVLVCGTLVLLGSIANSGIAPWMTLVVVCRELLVTTLRSVCEGQQIDFSAQWAGKVKMVVQTIGIVLSFVTLGLDAAAGSNWWWLTTIAMWIAIVSTVYSGWGYVLLAGQRLGLLPPR